MTNAKFMPLYQARGGLNRGRVVTEMALINLGEAQIVTIPGELLPEISFEIQEKMNGFPRAARLEPRAASREPRPRAI